MCENFFVVDCVVLDSFLSNSIMRQYSPLKDRDNIPGWGDVVQLIDPIDWFGIRCRSHTAVTRLEKKRIWLPATLRARKSTQRTIRLVRPMFDGENQVADPGDIIAFILSAAGTVLVEILAVEPLLKALFLDVTYPGVPSVLTGSIFVVLLLGSFIGMLVGFKAGIKKLFG